MQPNENPEAMLTPTMNGEECQLCEIKKHPIGIIMVYIQGAIGVIIAFGLLFFLIPQVLPDFSRSQHSLLVVAAVIVTALISLFLTIATKLYYASKLNVTDQKLTQTYQQGLFKRQVSRLAMANVEDVSAEKNGILATIFNFGTLKIETAGEEENFHFSYCPRPDYYAKLVLDAREKFERELHNVYVQPTQTPASPIPPAAN